MTDRSADVAPSDAAVEAVLSGGGAMGRAMRQIDWAGTALGPVERWPQSLKTVVRLLLDSRYAMWLAWGPQLTFFCNDAYRPTLGVKRGFLGASARDVWAEIWADIGPRIDHVLQSGQATWDEALMLFLERSGFPEETYHSFSYSPVYGDSGVVEGMLCVVSEETERVIGTRRLGALAAMSTATVPARGVAQACGLAVESLAGNASDLPFLLAYLFDDDAQTLQLCAGAGLEAGAIAAPRRIDIGDPGGHTPWPFAAVRASGEAQTVEDLAVRVGALHSPLWPEPIARAVVLPLARPGQDERLAGFLVVGTSPRLPFDAAYRRFLGLVAAQFANAISDARAFEQEKRRVEALAELDRAKTTFFANVSHELRTPLTLMLGPIADLLARPAGQDDAGRDLLALAQRNGQRLQRLVNSLLDFSRIEAGRMQARYEPVDLAAFSADLASVFRSASEKAGLVLVVDCAPLAQPVFVDRGMWEKIVFNLLSNALKFTFAGEIRVTLRAERDAALLRVSDSGTGIPPEALPRLFDRFFRVEGARGRSVEGSGIGLALVSELARLHGGSAAVQSRLGAGSTFSVRIPFGSAHLPPGDVVAAGTAPAGSGAATAFLDEAGDWLRDTGLAGLDAPAEASRVDRTGAGDATRPLVLIADDNADMRGYLRRLLEHEHAVIAAANGVEALRLVRERRPDLLLSDVMMPGLDGFALLRALRGDARVASLPVILLSARAGDEARIEGLAAGADDYLTKPFHARELLARVAGTLAVAKARRETENVLESITEGFVAVDAQWRFTYVNAAAESLFQTQRDALLGVPLWRVFPDLAGSAFEAPYRRAMEQRVPERVDGPYEPLGVWLEVSVYPVANGGLAFYFRDVLQSRRLEGSLRDSEARNRFLVELDQVLRRLADPSEIVQAAAKMLGEQLGAERCVCAELDADDEHLLIVADHAPRLPSLPARLRLADFGAALGIAYRAGAPFVFDDVETDPRVAAARPAFGALGVRAHLGVPLLNGQRCVAALALLHGAPRAWSATEVELAGAVLARCWEARDRARAERSLAASEAQFRTLADAMPQIVYVTAADGRVEFVNRQWREYTGQQGATTVDLRPAVHPDDLDALAARWEQAQERQEAFSAEFRLRRAADQAYRWFLTRAEPSRDAAGRLLRWYGTSTDIDAQKRNAEGLRRAHEALQETEQRKDQFLATLAHELRNPLAPLRNALHILQMSRGPETAERVHAMMQRQIDHLVRLVDDLLEMSRINSGKIELKRAPVRLADVLASAVETSRPLVDASHHTLELDIADPTLSVDGDAMRLAQVFANLLNNAAKYTGPGGRITLAVRRDGVHAVVSVRDNGIGIEPDMLLRVFELFVQVQSASTLAQGGLGIGLSLVRRLLALHGGSIEANSDGHGRGSEFVVRLPLIDAAAPDESAQPRRNALAAPRRVLVVDDNRDAADSLGVLLQFLGADVTVVHDGAAALEALDAHRPDVVLLDIGMPGMDGYEVARRMRALPHGRRMVLVALTGWGQEQDRQRTRESGFDHHLVKPADIDAVQALLEGSSAVALAEQRRQPLPVGQGAAASR